MYLWQDGCVNTQIVKNITEHKIFTFAFVDIPQGVSHIFMEIFLSSDKQVPEKLYIDL